MDNVTWSDRDGVRWIELEGDLDQNAYLDLKPSFETVARDSESDVIVLGNGVTFLCSMMIGLLVQSQKKLNERGHQLRVRGLNPGLRSILATLHLQDTLVDDG